MSVQAINNVVAEQYNVLPAQTLASAEVELPPPPPPPPSKEPEVKKGDPSSMELSYVDTYA